MNLSSLTPDKQVKLQYWLDVIRQCTIRRVRDLNPRDFYIQTVFKTAPSTNRTHGRVVFPW